MSHPAATLAPLAVPLVRAPTGQQSGQDAPNPDAEALIAAVVAAFLLADDEIDELSDAILDGRITSYAAAYAAAAAVADADLPDDWEPSKSVQTRQRDASDAAAASIAATYAADLHAHSAAFVDDWQATHDGSLAGAHAALRADLTTYADGRAGWKADQVASYETGQGAQDGTLDAVDDVENGYLLDGLGGVIDYSNLYVAVLPESSSSDFCADYAGEVFAFEDAPALDFPAHLGCIHYTIIATWGDVAFDDVPLD